MLSRLYHLFLYRPLFNGLIAAYVYLPGHDLGIAIIVLTALVRLVLHPLVARQYRSQRALSDLNPKVQDIRSRVKDQKEQTKQIMALYREAGVHPASGCLPLLIQLPVLFAIYRALADGLRPEALSELYRWIPRPEVVRTLAFGFLDLEKPSMVLAVAAGIFQYVQSRLLLPPPPPRGQSREQDITAMMSTQSLYVMPVITVIFALRFPAGLSLYWVTTTILGILQQVLLRRRHGTPSPLPHGLAR